MVFAVFTALVVGAASEDPFELEEIAQRESPRMHWEIALAGTIPRGVGVHLELGAMLGDRHVLTARATIATLLVRGSYKLGVSFAEWFADWLTIGLGACAALHNDFGETPISVGAQFPVRATFLLMSRKDGQREQRGLTFGVEVSPGFWTRPANVESPSLGFSLMGVLTFGWASW
ncbi:MAG: hypothetical protein JNM17_40630 [Archangium sp.]|nr:hypothetical protein [Archangium sp.]